MKNKKKTNLHKIIIGQEAANTIDTISKNNEFPYCATRKSVDDFIMEFARANTATNSTIMFIEKYLEFQDEDNCLEDVVRASALKVLCSKNYWGLTENYLETLKHYVKTTDWRYSETQIVAFSILASYLYESPSADILEFLISILNKELDSYDKNQDIETQNRIESIYRCLFEALNGELSSIGLISNKIKIPEDTNVLIVNVRNKILTLRAVYTS